MVKTHQKDSKKRLTSKHFNPSGGRARKINASTAYGTCSEQISPFGGLLGLTKTLELFDFEKLFNENFHAPSRETKLGDYAMVMGLVMLMFIGFNRVWHFVYIRLEAMLCGIFRVDKLPASSTYWRYLDSLGINQARSLLRIMSRLRQQAWKRFGIEYSHIAIDIDTTVETIYGDQEGGRVGHNPKHRGKKGYRPSRKEEAEFNSCMYQPTGWGQACRFVAMRIPKKLEETKSQPQQELFEKDPYTYRIFCTNLNGKAHEVIERYDKRADAENLIGEAKQEELAAIPSGKFKNNYAFFQIVMLAYNLWRYYKLLAGRCGKKVKMLAGVADNKIRIGRLKLLMIGAKLVKSGNRDMVKYSIHDSRTPALLRFFEFLDDLLFKKRQECKA